jgi:hypothetical protein
MTSVDNGSLWKKAGMFAPFSTQVRNGGNDANMNELVQLAISRQYGMLAQCGVLTAMQQSQDRIRHYLTSH